MGIGTLIISGTGSYWLLHEKDQMHFHTSDLAHDFKFIPILDKEPLILMICHNFKYFF